MTLKNFNFNVLNTEGDARLGIIQTHRGNIQTPAFMPVGTQATVKGVFLDDIIKTGSEGMPQRKWNSHTRIDIFD